MKQLNFLVGMVLPATTVLSLTANFPVTAETCKRLEAVGGEPGQTVVEKMVSAPSIPVGIASLKRDNWNTDFAVGSNVKYRRYVATLTPQTGGTYSIRVYLKYSDGTADEIYNNKPDLPSGKPLVMSGKPRTNEQPYQVNVFVGDAESVAKSYKIYVSACR